MEYKYHHINGQQMDSEVRKKKYKFGWIVEFTNNVIVIVVAQS